MMNRSYQLQAELRVLLREELSKRMKTNPRYSLRAFARDIGVDSSSLSHILSGKRSASKKQLSEISKVLRIPIEMTTEVPGENQFSRIDFDSFSVIADWYHFAILDIVQLKSFKSDPDWIARKLSISKAEAKLAIERLLRLGMLNLNDGKLEKAQTFFTNDLGIHTNSAKKEYQKQVISKAMDAVDACPQSLKDISSITIAADPARLELAREKIKMFRRELCALLEAGSKEDVYHLTIQLYPVTGAV